MKHLNGNTRRTLGDFLSSREEWGISLSGSGAVCRLERKFATLIDHPRAIAVSNATLGLWAIFMALDIHDVEVVTTPYTWGGSLSGLVLAGNRPVFADIDANSLTLDPKDVVRKITRRTKAILAVDIYGYPCDGPALRRIANEHGLALIQDCAQSLGAFLEDRHTGHWADAAVFSFTYGKALFAGEGAMIVTQQEDLYERLISETQHPIRQLRDVPHSPCNELAMNLRIHPFAAVWAEKTLEKALATVEKRRKKCLRTLDVLGSQRVMRTEMQDRQRVKPSFHVLTFEPDCTQLRIEEALREHHPIYRITLPPVTAPLYRHEAFKNLAEKRGWGKPQRCPVAEKQSIKRVRLSPCDAQRRNA